MLNVFRVSVWVHLDFAGFGWLPPDAANWFRVVCTKTGYSRTHTRNYSVGKEQSAVHTTYSAWLLLSIEGRRRQRKRRQWLSVALTLLPQCSLQLNTAAAVRVCVFVVVCAVSPFSFTAKWIQFSAGQNDRNRQQSESDM